MKKDILEHIIKNVLLERVRYGVAVSSTKKEEEQAKAAGADKWAAVKIKGKGSVTEISNQVFAAIAATPELGVRSKYARSYPDYHAYVYATPLTNVRKQRIPVWVYKFNKPFLTQGSLSDTEHELYSGVYRLGETMMMSKGTFEELLKKQDVWEQEKIRLQQLQSQEETEEDEKINTDNAAAAKRQEWLNQNDTENLTFPYTWYTFDGNNNPVEYVVYKSIILDNKEYLYTYNESANIWLVMERPELFIPMIIKQQLNPNFDTSNWSKVWLVVDPNDEDKIKLDSLRK